MIRRKYNSLKAERRKIYLKILHTDNPSEVKHQNGITY